VRRLHFIWFAHQPFFIPDDEVRWRVHCSYVPLIDAFCERSIPFSFALTGALLERLQRIEPGFLELLRERHVAGDLLIAGAPAHHPMLPWLSTNAGRAQIRVDREVREAIGLPRADVLWPTELAWSMTVGHLACDEGYGTVVIDSRTRDRINVVPQWQNAGDRLAPKNEQIERLRCTSRLVLDLEADRTLSLWVREAKLSHLLVHLVRDNEVSEGERLVRFLHVLDTLRSNAVSANAPLLLGEDVERVLPDGIAAFLQLLDDLKESGVSFCSAGDFARSSPAEATSYVPAGTMEGEDALWEQSMDDRCFRQQLERVTTRMEERINLAEPRDREERFWRDRLLRIQDSGFYFWRYVARTRRPFYDELHEIEAWLNSHLAAR